jgi:PGF-CTERM protein
VYHGEVVVTDGNLQSPVLVEAVADGEVQDSLMTDGDGQLGGPGVSDDKLEVQEPDSGEVEFHIGGEPVQTVEFEPGGQELTLEVQQSEIAPEFTVNNLTTNSPVDGGSTLRVNATIENTGATEATQDIELVGLDGNVTASESVTLAYTDQTSVSFAVETSRTQNETGSITLRSADTNASAEVTIERTEPPSIAPTPSPPAPPSGGDDGGDADGENGSDGDSETDLPADITNGTDVISTEAQPVVSDDGFGLSQVRFSTASALATITWETPDINGTVRSSTLASAPAGTPAVPGAVLSVSHIDVNETTRDTPATLQFRVNETQLAAQDIAAEDLTIAQGGADGWELRTTEQVSTDESDTLLLQTEATATSLFAVTAVGEPTAEIAAPDSATVNESLTLDGTDSADQYGTIESYEWTVAGETQTGETTSITPTTAGELTVELMVTNDAGRTATTTTTIDVSPSADSAAGDSDDGTSGTDGDGGTTDDGIPGFGAVVALVALIAAALLATRRNE